MVQLLTAFMESTWPTAFIDSTPEDACYRLPFAQALREEAQARAGEASTHSNGGLMMPRSSYPALNG